MFVQKLKLSTILNRSNIKIVFFSTEIDPIQQLFVNSLREYDKKKKQSGGAMFDPIPELENERQQHYNTALKHFFKNNPPSDPAAFPTFTFKDVPLDDIHVEEEKKEDKKEIKKEEKQIDKKKDDKK